MSQVLVEMPTETWSGDSSSKPVRPISSRFRRRRSTHKSSMAAIPETGALRNEPRVTRYRCDSEVEDQKDRRPIGDRFRSSTPMRATDQSFIDRTREVFQPRTARALSDEDARQIAEHLTGFFGVLLEWQAAERTLRSETADATSNRSTTTQRRLITPRAIKLCSMVEMTFLALTIPP